MTEAYTAAKAQALEAELLRASGNLIESKPVFTDLLSRAATMIQTQRLLLSGDKSPHLNPPATPCEGREAMENTSGRQNADAQR